MSQGDELGFQGGAATHPERRQGNQGGQEYELADAGMAAAPTALHFPSFLES